MAEDRITLRVTRYRPEQEAEPTVADYEVPLRPEWTVLDGLNYIKDQHDGTLSYRWSCRMGICGSCGMTVNDDPKLTCGTFLTDYAPGPIRVEPLRNFPVIRDLIVEIGDFLRKLVRVQPWLTRAHNRPIDAGEYLQTPSQLDDYKQFSMCINCMLCYSACPVVAKDPEFLGPAAIALAHRYNLDSRDQGRAERHRAIAVDWGIWDCTFVGECSVVCPKDVDPAAAIQREKVAKTTDTMLSMVLPFGGAG
ncbi:MAG: succinate dehydrogenase/fumarate reductase iron-sulfur subunit [Actinomycetota bacterium]